LKISQYLIKLQNLLAWNRHLTNNDDAMYWTAALTAHPGKQQWWLAGWLCGTWRRWIRTVTSRVPFSSPNRQCWCEAAYTGRIFV